jgi:uncharacterized protein
MIRWLLVVAVVLFVLWLIRRGAGRASGTPPGSPQPMVRCAHCGVHLPRGDALMLGEQAFCCASHRDAGARRE